MEKENGKYDIWIINIQISKYHIYSYFLMPLIAVVNRI